ncbi:MAG: hypothetical protein GY715_09710 [Planctomycetes bacterium]|nr:hypothetical protein [Planctomycetota bacterium]
MLLTMGVRWLRAGSSPVLLLLAVAAAIGVVKAVTVLRQAARRISGRIRSRDDCRCVGGFFSWRTWLFVAAMMGLGFVVRASPIPAEVVGVVYAAVGVALLIASGYLWLALRDHRAAARDGS